MIKPYVSKDCFVLMYQRKLEEVIERKRRHLREREAIIRDKANDINKANEIISKLQGDNVAFHSEVKLALRAVTA